MKRKKAEQALKTAVGHHQTGRIREAGALYRTVLDLDPANPLALHNLGVIELEAGRFDQAITLLKKSIRIRPDYPPAHGNLGIALNKAGRREEAITSLAAAIRMEPRDPSNYFNLGNILKDKGQFDEAVVSYRQALALNPGDAEVLSNLGSALTDLERPEEGAEECRRALALNPRLVDAHINLGNALRQTKDYDEATRSYENALALEPGCVLAMVDLARIRNVKGEFGDALAICDRVLGIDPAFLPAVETRGYALAGLKEFEEAMACFERAAEIDPEDYKPHVGRGFTFSAQKKPDLALEAYRRAAELNPKEHNTLTTIASILFELGRLRESLLAFSKAVDVKPDHVPAICGLGQVFLYLSMNKRAATCYRKALQIDDTFSKAYNGLGYALGLDGIYREAIEQFAKAEELEPGVFTSNLVYFQQKVCDWNAWPELLPKIIKVVREGEAKVSLLCLSSITDSPEDLMRAAQASTDQFFQDAWTLPPRPEGLRHDRIRLGYLSGDFHDHPVCHLAVEMLERHDRSRFEITGYSYGPSVDHEMRRRVVAAFDHFVDIYELSFRDAAKRIQDDEIDILIDLTGYTQLTRTQIVTYRPAPVTVSHLGYPGTMAADFFDYIIVDPYLAPMEDQPFYTERIVQLPDCYQPGDTKRRAVETSRESCGLPGDGLVLCAFNNPSKITPELFGIWMRVLKAAPGAVLWLKGSGEEVRANLTREAAARDVDPLRLVFADIAPFDEYLGRLALADLFLDCYPYNAGATANDALWMGLPVLTRSGATYVSRMAGSLLSTLGLPELITHSAEEYEALAIELVTRPERLAALRTKLAAAREDSPLFDIARYTRNIEAAYRRMWEIHEAKEEPHPFAVTP